MPRLLAPSISRTSRERPSVISFALGSSSENREKGRWCSEALSEDAAMVVLPVPRGANEEVACAMRFLLDGVGEGWVTCSCPITSEKRCGRYLRAMTW